jgi:Tol biopolymer transport system component/DNA-binding winged helix-turn-helix (wHTH) protein
MCLNATMFTTYLFAEDMRLVTNETGLRTLYRGGTPVKRLGQRNLHLLHLLVADPGVHHTRTEILRVVWGDPTLSEGSVIKAVSVLRKKALGPGREGLIQSTAARAEINRDGEYWFAGPVELDRTQILPTRSTKQHPWFRAVAAKAIVDAPASDAVGASDAVDKEELAFSEEKSTHSQAGNQSDSNAGSSIKPLPVEPHIPIDSRKTITRTRRSLQRIQFYTGALLLAAIVFLVIAILKRRLEPMVRSVQIQPVIRQSREILSPMVTDGTQLYFPECVSGRLQLGRVNVQAVESESTPVATILHNPDLADISPDGNYLLVREVPRFVTDKSQFHAQPTDGRPAIRLGNLQGLDGTWSRDQKEIYFGVDEKIYVAESDGSNPRIFLDQLHGRPFWLRWSPNGKILRFSLIQKHLNTIWEVTTDDKTPRQLRLEADGGDFWCCGNWDNTGNHYFYQSRVKGIFQIWRVDSSGKPVPFEQQLEDYRGPTPARNGGVLFARSEAQRAELERYDPVSHAVQPLLSTISISTAALSPDGQWIAYTTFPAHGLYVARSDGNQRYPLTDPSIDAVLPAWSPNGARIAFMSRIRGRWEVYIVSAQGGDAKPLFESGQDETRDATWSRDSTQLLVGYGPTIKGNSKSMALYIVDVNSKIRNRVPGSEGLFSPRWSPDGRYIAALSDDATKLLVYDLDNPQIGWRIVIRDANLGYPNWSNNSRALYVLDTTGKENTIKRVHLPDMKLETYVNLAGYQQPCTTFGTWIGIDGDAPLFIKDVSTRMIGAFK